MSSLGLELGLGWTLLARYLIFSTYVLYLHGKGRNAKKWVKRVKTPPKLVWQKFRKSWWAVLQILMSSCAPHIYSVFITEMSNLSNVFFRSKISLQHTFCPILTWSPPDHLQSQQGLHFWHPKSKKKMMSRGFAPAIWSRHRLLCFITNIKNTAGKSAKKIAWKV